MRRAVYQSQEPALSNDPIVFKLYLCILFLAAWVFEASWAFCRCLEQGLLFAALCGLLVAEEHGLGTGASVVKARGLAAAPQHVESS